MAAAGEGEIFTERYRNYSTNFGYTTLGTVTDFARHGSWAGASGNVIRQAARARQKYIDLRR
jgi:hypothetical protein